MRAALLVAVLFGAAAELRAAPVPREAVAREHAQRLAAAARERAARQADPRLAKLARVYDAMTPEGAATILKRFAESGAGKLDQAADVLALMDERNAARLLEAMSDPALAEQLVERMRRPGK